MELYLRKLAKFIGYVKTVDIYIKVKLHLKYVLCVPILKDISKLEQKTINKVTIYINYIIILLNINRASNSKLLALLLFPNIFNFYDLYLYYSIYLDFACKYLLLIDRLFPLLI